MKYAIHITDMTAGELATVSAFLESMGASPASVPGPKGRQTVAELAAATGATPAQQQPAPPAAPAAPVGDPFAAPAAIPAPPVTQTPAPPPAGELDSKGLPYNPEFHTETKRRNNDGSWAKRKGVNKEACAAWEASMAGRPAAPQTPAAPAPTVTVPAPTVTAPAPTAEQINQMHGVTTPPNGHTVVPPSTVSDPFAAPAPVAPPAPPAPPAEIKRVTYNEWYGLYGNLLSSGKISPEKYSEIAGRYGALDNAMVFMQDEDARSRCFAEFEALAAA